MDQKKALNQLSEISKLKGNMRLAGEDWATKYQTLIAIILSARSLDETTVRVCKDYLFKEFPTAHDLANANLEHIENIIRPINFYLNKSRLILNCANQLVEKYSGEPPMDFDKLVELSGVGGKTANVFLSEYGTDAIGVDTHLAYTSNKLGWSNKKDPTKIQKDLENLFPKKDWIRLNPIVVKFGKKYTSRKEKDKLLDEIKAKP